MKINIIGCGKVGEHLYNALKNKGEDCRLVNSRTLDGFEEDAEVALICVTDSAISEVADKFKNYPGIVCHVSGSTSIDALKRTSKGGVFYPFQSFSKGVEVNFKEVPILLEGTDAETLEKLKELAKKLTDKIYEADGYKRGQLHLAGVFSCNFVNEMLASGFRIMKEADLPIDLLYPLIRLTINKALDLGPEKTRTGPAVRRDFPTMEKQIQQLSEKPLETEVYKSVTDLIISRT